MGQVICLSLHAQFDRVWLESRAVYLEKRPLKQVETFRMNTRTWETSILEQSA